MKTYSELRPHINTGSILFFSGTGLVSETIKLVTRSEWSHVGICFDIPEAKMVWESTSLSGKNGVQLNFLSDRIEQYLDQGGEVAVRRIRKPLNIQQIGDLSLLRQKLKGRPYESSLATLVKAAYDGPWGEAEEDDSSLFCSELIAYAFKAVRFLPEDTNPAEYVPGDFVHLCTPHYDLEKFRV